MPDDRVPNPSDEWDGVGMTPLLYAIFVGDIEAVRVLMEKGADRDITNDGRDTPLLFARTTLA